MKIAFLGVRVPGHLNSTTTLARKLKARGHDVVFLNYAEPVARTDSANAPRVSDFAVQVVAAAEAGPNCCWNTLQRVIQSG
jgi:UDP:flavonoid glycosyltransferase YjiC (YdhE family)